jgi:regulator of protease activity HflC (stomatin/prohibitin superfamily)
MRYYKGEPTKYIVKYRAGRIKRKGMGIGFWYRTRRANVVSIPATTIDSNFIFNELTKNHQSISLQGHFTYKITDPLKMTTILDFSIEPHDNVYISEDPEKLELRIRNEVQMIVKSKMMKMNLQESLFAAEEFASHVMGTIPGSQILTDMGIELLSIAFTSIRPTPEIASALEADYRESLQRKADEAIYARRAAAVEQESKIKENQLQTQITLEEQKKTLIDLEGENVLKEAKFQADAKKLELANYAKMDKAEILAHALKELSEQAEKIGNLTITSEILAALLKDKKD